MKIIRSLPTNQSFHRQIARATSRLVVKGSHGPTIIELCKTLVNWGAFNHASYAPQLSLATITCKTLIGVHLTMHLVHPN